MAQADMSEPIEEEGNGRALVAVETVRKPASIASPACADRVARCRSRGSRTTSA